MKTLIQKLAVASCLLGVLTCLAPETEAGLFSKLFKCRKSCEPVCCEPEPEPEPCCCPVAEPEPAPCCCAPEPTCCEPAPEPTCCEPAPEPCCTSTGPVTGGSLVRIGGSYIRLAPGETLVSVSPMTPARAFRISQPQRLAMK